MASNLDPSMALAREFNKLVANASSMSTEEVLRALDDIEAQHAPRSDSGQKALETRRRVAEWKLKLLSERDLPADQIETLRSAIDRLGFTNLEVEATIELYFAKYLIRNGRGSLAGARLNDLLAKLQTAAAAGDPFASEDLIKDTERLLANSR